MNVSRQHNQIILQFDPNETISKPVLSSKRWIEGVLGGGILLSFAAAVLLNSYLWLTVFVAYMSAAMLIWRHLSLRTEEAPVTVSNIRESLSAIFPVLMYNEQKNTVEVLDVSRSDVEKVIDEGNGRFIIVLN